MDLFCKSWYINLNPDKNSRFNVDTFDKGNINFLDIYIYIYIYIYLYIYILYILNNSDADIYVKDTGSGLLSKLWTSEHKNCLGMLIL